MQILNIVYTEKLTEKIAWPNNPKWNKIWICESLVHDIVYISLPYITVWDCTKRTKNKRAPYRIAGIVFRIPVPQ